MSGWVWAIIAGLIAANALYVAAEFGAVGVRRSRVRRLADDGNAFARLLLPFIESPASLDRYVGVSQIGITLSSLMLGAYAQATVTVALAPLLERSLSLEPLTAVSAAAVTVLVALTAVQLVIGELVPKALALQFPTETALATVLPMRWSLVVVRPFIGLLNGTALAILRVFGATEQAHRHLHSPEEIDLLITESRDGGLLEPDEQQRLRRALHLGLRSAKDLMVPRDRLTMLEAGASWEEVVRTVARSPFSRLPVYRTTPDRVVGFLRVKDLVDRYVTEGPLPLERLSRPVTVVAADLPADLLIAHLRERRAHAAIVHDADHRAIGLVTIQDVVGALLLEQDRSGDPVPVTSQPVEP